MKTDKSFCRRDAECRKTEKEKKAGYKNSRELIEEKNKTGLD